MIDVGLHNNLTWLSFPSVGSPQHKVFQVELLEGLVQLDVFFIICLVSYTEKIMFGSLCRVLEPFATVKM